METSHNTESHKTIVVCNIYIYIIDIDYAKLPSLIINSSTQRDDLF